MKRIFDINIATCSECGGDVKIISSIEDPAVINRILTHLDEQAATDRSRALNYGPDCAAIWLKT